MKYISMGAEIQTNVISADRACNAAVAHPLYGDEGRIAVLFTFSSRFKVIALPVIGLLYHFELIKLCYSASLWCKMKNP